jgi:long-subunit acyl-CoA synthetase (AMP-forming)
MTTPERPATLCEAFQRTASSDPDADSVGPYAAQHGLSDASPAALAADPEVIARIAEGVAEGNAKLSRVEQSKSIMTKYTAEIEELCARELHPEVHEPSEAAAVQPA